MIPESHKAIGSKLHSYIEGDYGLTLNKKRLLWGSVSPDILPKYKFISHYKDASLDYIVNEIVSLILKTSFLGELSSINPVFLNHLSYKLGVISHYITDYTTHPHARKIRCTSRKKIREHIGYEMELNDYIKKENLFTHKDNLYGEFSFLGEVNELKDYVRDSINRIVDEYLTKPVGFEYDLSYSLQMNFFVFQTIFEAAYSLSTNPQLQIV